MFGSGFGSPVLNENAFARESEGRWDEAALERAERRLNQMTVEGTVRATAVLLGITAAVAIATYGLLANSGGGYGWLPLVSGLAGFGLALVISFKPKLAPMLGPVYAGVQGVFVGGVSLFYASWAGAMNAQQAANSGVSNVVSQADTSIIFQAAVLTFGVAGGVLIAYSTRLIRVTDMMVKGIVAATMGVLALLMVNLVLGLFGVNFSLFGGTFGLLFAGFIVVLAAANLLVDFRLIEDMSKQGAPKYMNWFGAFGVLVTLVWLYLSILRLLALLRGRE